MASMRIVGITGRARSGKDTLADMIVAASRSGIWMSFADPIRHFIARVSGLPYAELVDSPRKETPIPDLGNKSPRQMMQTLGTEWGRDLIDSDLWIKVARREL